MSPSEASTLLAGAAALPGTGPRSPDATRRAAALSCTGSAPSDRIRLRLISVARPMAARMAAMAVAISVNRLVLYFSAALRISCSPEAVMNCVYCVVVPISCLIKGWHSAFILAVASSLFPARASATMSSATGP
ncbi:hypothetical protein D3C71_1583500 [compost metagenome]